MTNWIRKWPPMLGQWGVLIGGIKGLGSTLRLDGLYHKWMKTKGSTLNLSRLKNLDLCVILGMVIVGCKWLLLLNFKSDYLLISYAVMWNCFSIYMNIFILIIEWFELMQQDKHAKCWLDSIRETKQGLQNSMTEWCQINSYLFIILFDVLRSGHKLINNNICIIKC